MAFAAPRHNCTCYPVQNPPLHTTRLKPTPTHIHASNAGSTIVAPATAISACPNCRCRCAMPNSSSASAPPQQQSSQISSHITQAASPSNPCGHTTNAPCVCPHHPHLAPSTTAHAEHKDSRSTQTQPPRSSPSAIFAFSTATTQAQPGPSAPPPEQTGSKARKVTLSFQKDGGRTPVQGAAKQRGKEGNEKPKKSDSKQRSSSPLTSGSVTAPYAQQEPALPPRKEDCKAKYHYSLTHRVFVQSPRVPSRWVEYHERADRRAGEISAKIVENSARFDQSDAKDLEQTQQHEEEARRRGELFQFHPYTHSYKLDDDAFSPSLELTGKLHIEDFPYGPVREPVFMNYHPFHVPPNRDSSSTPRFYRSLLLDPPASFSGGTSSSASSSSRPLPRENNFFRSNEDSLRRTEFKGGDFPHNAAQRSNDQNRSSTSSSCFGYPIATTTQMNPAYNIDALLADPFVGVPSRVKFRPRPPPSMLSSSWGPFVSSSRDPANASAANLSGHAQQHHVAVAPTVNVSREWDGERKSGGQRQQGNRHVTFPNKHSAHEVKRDAANNTLQVQKETRETQTSSVSSSSRKKKNREQKSTRLADSFERHLVPAFSTDPNRNKKQDQQPASASSTHDHPSSPPVPSSPKTFAYLRKSTPTRLVKRPKPPPHVSPSRITVQPGVAYIPDGEKNEENEEDHEPTELERLSRSLGKKNLRLCEIIKHQSERIEEEEKARKKREVLRDHILSPAMEALERRWAEEDATNNHQRENEEDHDRDNEVSGAKETRMGQRDLDLDVETQTEVTLPLSIQIRPKTPGSASTPTSHQPFFSPTSSSSTFPLPPFAVLTPHSLPTQSPLGAAASASAQFGSGGDSNTVDQTHTQTPMSDLELQRLVGYIQSFQKMDRLPLLPYSFPSASAPSSASPPTYPSYPTSSIASLYPLLQEAHAAAAASGQQHQHQQYTVEKKVSPTKKSATAKVKSDSRKTALPWTPIQDQILLSLGVEMPGKWHTIAGVFGVPAETCQRRFRELTAESGHASTHNSNPYENPANLALTFNENDSGEELQNKSNPGQLTTDAASLEEAHQRLVSLGILKTPYNEIISSGITAVPDPSSSTSASFSTSFAPNTVATATTNMTTPITSSFSSSTLDPASSLEQPTIQSFENSSPSNTLARAHDRLEEAKRTRNELFGPNHATNFAFSSSSTASHPSFERPSASTRIEPLFPAYRKPARFSSPKKTVTIAPESLATLPAASWSGRVGGRQDDPLPQLEIDIELVDDPLPNPN